MSSGSGPRPLIEALTLSGAGLPARFAVWLVGVVIGLAVFSGPSAAEQVFVRSGAHTGYARIVIDWPAPITFQAGIDGRTLRVTFDRDAEGDFSKLLSLTNYVAAVELTNSNRTLTLSLSGDFGLRTSQFSNSVVIDLLSSQGAVASSAARASSSGAASASATPGAANRLPVRFGEHAGFTRVVFDWTQTVPYQVEKNGDEIIISFDRRAAPDLARLQRYPPRYIRTISSDTAGGRLNVRFQVVSGTGKRDFRDGAKIVLDILAGQAQVAAVQTIDRPASQAPRQLVNPSATPAASGPGDPGASAEAVATARAISKAEGLRPSLLKIKGGIQLSFPWNTLVRAAVFKRAGYLWVVFDSPSNVDLSVITPAYRTWLPDFMQLPDREATILRFKVGENQHAWVRRRDATWMVDISPLAGDLQERLAARRELNIAGNARVFVEVLDVGELVQIKDPEVGDSISAIPVLGPGKGVPNDRFYAEFHLLSTYQGVAVLPLGDNVMVEPRRNGVRIYSKSGLVLSESRLPDDIASESLVIPGSLEAVKEAEEKAIRIDKFLDFEDWGRGPRSVFYQNRTLLLRAIAAAPTAGKNAVRWNLARFYFAHNMLPEAIGVMEIIPIEDPYIENDPVFNLVRGTVNYLMGRTEEAAVDLAHPGLDSQRHAAVWRGAVAVRNKDWEKALFEFEKGAALLIDYPDVYRIKLRLAHAQAAEAMEDSELLEEILDGLEGMLGLTASTRAAINYYRGRQQEFQGENQEAVESYARVFASNYRPMIVQAQRADVELQLKMGLISRTRQLEVMERLRHAWRGGDFELDILHKLGLLYFEVGDSPNGLKTLRKAITYFPDTDQAKDIAREMNEKFQDLFLGSGADRIAPVSALALFYDFRELTPIGQDGDEMIRKLSDRLVAVDLLDQAAELLDHQINFRLNPLEKAQIGARLALVHLLNRKPKDALQTLRNSRRPLLPVELEAQRRHLETRALMELNRREDALTLLTQDFSEEADRLRVDIFWGAKDWARAADMIERLLEESWQREGLLEDFERGEVMRLVVALSLADDRDGLDRINDLFAEKMEGTVDWASFKILTGNIDPKTIQFRRLAGTIAAVNTLENFMTQYREKLQEGALSTIN